VNTEIFKPIRIVDSEICEGWWLKIRFKDAKGKKFLLRIKKVQDNTFGISVGGVMTVNMGERQDIGLFADNFWSTEFVTVADGGVLAQMLADVFEEWMQAHGPIADIPADTIRFDIDILRDAIRYLKLKAKK
jgi:hypothetical protein